MGKMSRTKGRAWEQAVARLLRPIFGDQQVKRGNQTRFGNDSADIEGVPFHIECKHEQRLDIRAAMRQATAATDGRPVVVIGKENLKPPGWSPGKVGTPPIAVMWLDDWLRLAARAELSSAPARDNALVDGRLVAESQVVVRFGNLCATLPGFPKPLLYMHGTGLWLRSDLDAYEEERVHEVKNAV